MIVLVAMIIASAGLPAVVWVVSPGLAFALECGLVAGRGTGA